MNPDARASTAGRFRRACTAGRGERVARGVIALVLAAVAAESLSHSPLVAIAAGVAALAVLFLALTGYCFGVSGVATEPGDGGYVDARRLLSLHALPDADADANADAETVAVPNVGGAGAPRKRTMNEGSAAP